MPRQASVVTEPHAKDVFRVGREIARDSGHLCSGTAEMTKFRRNGPRATAKSRSFHRRARACPSPGIGLKKTPGPLGCGRFSCRLKDREGQAPALRSKKAVFFGGSRGTGPRATAKSRSFHRRARACPSPGIGLKKTPGPLGCGRFSRRSGDRGGQAPALRFKCGLR